MKIEGPGLAYESGWLYDTSRTPDANGQETLLELTPEKARWLLFCALPQYLSSQEKAAL